MDNESACREEDTLHPLLHRNHSTKTAAPPAALWPHSRAHGCAQNPPRRENLRLFRHRYLVGLRESLYYQRSAVGEKRQCDGDFFQELMAQLEDQGIAHELVCHQTSPS